MSTPSGAGPSPELKALRESSRGKGTVWLAFDDDWYWGYWDLEPDGPPTLLERYPSSPHVSDALAWGRARTPVVLIRPEHDPGQYYWAGTGPRPALHADLPTFDPETG